jgi:hypothetical protein
MYYVQNNVLNNIICKLIKERRYFSTAKLYDREREGNGASKFHGCTSGSPLANPKYGHFLFHLILYYPIFLRYTLIAVTLPMKTTSQRTSLRSAVKK